MYNDDSLLWLEEVEGSEALDWVRTQNAATHKKYSKTKTYQKLFSKADELLNSEDRIPFASFHGDYVYNFWKDKMNPKGIYRRTTFDDYQNDKPNWEIVLDLDSLAKEENEDWVWGGVEWLSHSSNLGLILLSRGGKDAEVVREFNFHSKSFVEAGFKIEESKTAVDWIDEDTLIVGTTLDGCKVTDSGYPAQLSIWKRGTSLDSAKVIYECSKEHMGLWPFSLDINGKLHTFITEQVTFYTEKVSRVIDEQCLDTIIPPQGQLNDIYKNHIIISLREEWTHNGTLYPSGSIVSINMETDQTSLVVKPTESSFPTSASATDDYLYVQLNNNVANEVICYELIDNKWTSRTVALPKYGSIYIQSKKRASNKLLALYYNFLRPDTLYSIDGVSAKQVKGISEKFDSEKYAVEQHFATSKDGTKIPYFQIANKNLELNGKNPTLQYGYGGFEISLTPLYSANLGNLWLDQGGVYILTNIRGGGEFGSKWHQAALKENRQKAYDDFIAISEDLIRRKVTSPIHLGIAGGSNGGLLMGAITTQRPDLYGAVVCQVPLLDMKRYHLLLAGASWIGEYGDPDKPEEWEYISKYSPLQNIENHNKYPTIFFMTSTKDDRVHPGHARKMAKKMMDLGHDIEYFENITGGHGGSTTQSDRAHWDAIEYTFLLEKLKGDIQ